MRVTFEVEQAGCASCADRVRKALSPLASVEAVLVDHDTDVASVALSGRDDISPQPVEEALARASTGSGHTYRIRPDSWRTDSAESP